MSKSSFIRVKIETDLKNKAENIFRRLGFTTTQAITLFYEHVGMRNGLPFEAPIPNETTCRTLEGTDAGRNLIVCDDTDAMLAQLGI